MRIELRIARVGRTGSGEIDEVAIEIDIVFSGPRTPGKAVGIDRVNEEKRHAARKGACKIALHPTDLRRRTAEAFEAVRTAQDHQLRSCARIAEPRHVDAQILAIRALERRMGVGGQRGADVIRSVAKLHACAVIVERKTPGEIIRERYHHAVNPRATLAASACDTMMPSA